MHQIDSLLCAILLIGAVSGQCLPEWSFHNGHCYRMFYEPNNRVTYVTAQERCRAHKGRLSDVKDEAEWLFIGNLARTGLTLMMSEKPIIGLYKTERNNPVNVFDGSKPYINWCPGEPTMTAGIEFCVVIVADAEYYKDHPVYPAPRIPCMSDLACDGHHTANGFSRYMCKVPPQIVCDKPNTEAAVNGTCVCQKDYIDITETDVPEKTKYKPGEKCISTDPCKDVKELSVNFLIDSSDSIGQDNWDSLVTFLKSGADFLPNSSRVGFVKFSNNITFAKFLEAGWSKSEFQKFVPFRYDKGETNTPAAFEKATAMFKKDKNKNQVSVLITDGLPFDGELDEPVVQKKTKDAAKKLRSKGISLIALGYGEDLDIKKIRVIHSWLEDPEEDYFEYHKNAANLKSIHMCLLMRKICRRAIKY